MRILCLHDAHSDARALQAQLAKLDERLWQKHGRMELVYVNAPLVVHHVHNHLTTKDNGTQQPRAWWQACDDSDPRLGMDASLLLLVQLWKATPFAGILGVGQGALMGRLLASRLRAAAACGATGTRAPPQALLWITNTSHDDWLDDDEYDDDAMSSSTLHLVRDSTTTWSTPCLNRMGRHLVEHRQSQQQQQQQGD
jgi:hypothetical protein